MNTLTSAIQSKFKPVFTVTEYQDLVVRYWTDLGARFSRTPEGLRQYWDRLPEFTIAICPICNAHHTDGLDLHSLRIFGGGGISEIDSWGYRRRAWNFGCEHYVSAHGFLHLNEHLPDKILGVGCEVPYVTLSLLPENESQAYCVMNAFPICRIQEDQFIPSFTLFLLTYYAPNPHEARTRRWQEFPGLLSNSEWSGGPPLLYTVEEAWKHRADKVFDLRSWVEAGRLFWVDEQSEVPTLKNQIDEFPYVNIEGIADAILYKDGARKVLFHEHEPRYYPTWKPEDWPKEVEKPAPTWRDRLPSIFQGSYWLILLIWGVVAWCAGLYTIFKMIFK